MPQHNDKAGPPTRSTENSQAVDRATRKPPNVERLIPREVRDSVVARLTVHGKTPQKVARETGLSQREIIEVLLNERELDTRKRVARAYDAGRMNPLPPIASARRVA